MAALRGVCRILPAVRVARAALKGVSLRAPKREDPGAGVLAATAALIERGGGLFLRASRGEGPGAGVKFATAVVVWADGELSVVRLRAPSREGPGAGAKASTAVGTGIDGVTAAEEKGGPKRSEEWGRSASSTSRRVVSSVSSSEERAKDHDGDERGSRGGIERERGGRDTDPEVLGSPVSRALARSKREGSVSSRRGALSRVRRAAGDAICGENVANSVVSSWLHSRSFKSAVSIGTGAKTTSEKLRVLAAAKTGSESERARGTSVSMSRLVRVAVAVGALRVSCGGNNARGTKEGVNTGLTGLAAETGGAQGTLAAEGEREEEEEREGKTSQGRDDMARRIVACDTAFPRSRVAHLTPNSHATIQLLKVA